MCAVWPSHSKLLSMSSNISASSFELNLNIPPWNLFRWLRVLQLWATGDWQPHHWQHAHSCITSCAEFLAKYQITQVTQHPYSPDLVPCDFLLFPKLNSALKVKRFQTIMRFRKIRCGSWWWLGELCDILGAYFEGEWGIIVLCTVFLVSRIFSKRLYFSYYMAGYLLDRPCMEVRSVDWLETVL